MTFRVEYYFGKKLAVLDSGESNYGTASGRLTYVETMTLQIMTLRAHLINHYLASRRSDVIVPLQQMEKLKQAVAEDCRGQASFHLFSRSTVTALVSG